MTCEAKLGWSFADISILSGQQYRYGQRSLWSLEVQYDRVHKNCRMHRKYFGFAANYSFNENYSERGLKVMWDPINSSFPISRMSRFYPYIFGQGNYSQEKSNDLLTSENKLINSYSFRPGLGLTANFKEPNLLSLRAYIQVGYNLPINHTPNFKNSLIFEFKVGVGLHARRLRRQKEVEAE